MKYLTCVLLALTFAAAVSAQRTALPTDFTATAMDGSTIDTPALRGKIVVLNLWFINCPNCIDEIKLLNKLVDEYKGQKDVVFVALASSKKADLVKFLTKNPFSYQIVPDATSIILGKFGTPDKNGGMSLGFPMHYVLDRDGKVVLKMQGIKGVDVVRTELKKQLPVK